MASKDRRIATFLAAAAEIEDAKRTFPTFKEKLEMQAARMRARRMIESLGGRGDMPAELRRKVERHLPHATD